MSKIAEDVAKVREHVEATIGSDPEQWTKWPGGWPDDIESALMDAVFSARAVYRTKHGRGIYRNVDDWQKRRERVTFSLDALIAEINAVGVPAWGSQLRQLSGIPRPTRGRTMRPDQGGCCQGGCRQAAQGRRQRRREH